MKRCATAPASNPTTTPTPLAAAASEPSPPCSSKRRPPRRSAASPKAFSSTWGSRPRSTVSIRRVPEKTPRSRSSRSPRRTSRCVRSSSSCPTSTGPTTSCSSCSTACSERSAGCRSSSSQPPASTRTSGGGRRVATTRSRSTSIRSTAVAARQLLDSVAEARLPRRVADQLLDRSGGNPFFLEELASLICDSADIGEDLPELPDNIRGLVAARLDTLSPGERATLEDAAVLGRSGPVTALATLAVDRVPIDAPAKFDDDGRGRARRPRVEGPPLPRRRPVDVPVRVGARGRLQHAHQGVARPSPRRDRRAVRQRRGPRSRRAPRAGRGAPCRGERARR